MKTFYYFDTHKKNTHDTPSYEYLKKQSEELDSTLLKNATTKKPPQFLDHEIPLFDIKKKSWYLEKDYRKETIWYLENLKEDDFIWQSYIVEKLGDPQKELEEKGIIYSEISFTKPKDTLYMQKLEKLSLVEDCYNDTKKDFLKINLENKTYLVPSDEKEFKNFKRSINYQDTLEDNLIEEIQVFKNSKSVKAEETAFLKTDKKTFQNILNSAENIFYQNFQNFKDLRLKIISSNSTSELSQIDPQSGWNK